MTNHTTLILIVCLCLAMCVCSVSALKVSNGILRTELSNGEVYTFITNVTTEPSDPTLVVDITATGIANELTGQYVKEPMTDTGIVLSESKFIINPGDSKVITATIKGPGFRMITLTASSSSNIASAIAIPIMINPVDGTVSAKIADIQLGDPTLVNIVNNGTKYIYGLEVASGNITTPAIAHAIFPGSAVEVQLSPALIDNTPVAFKLSAGGKLLDTTGKIYVAPTIVPTIEPTLDITPAQPASTPVVSTVVPTQTKPITVDYGNTWAIIAIAILAALGIGGYLYINGIPGNEER